MDKVQFRIIVRILGLLLRAIVWGSDPAGTLERMMSQIETEVLEETLWIRKDKKPY